jgi:hypothetical protein
MYTREIEECKDIHSVSEVTVYKLKIVRAGDVSKNKADVDWYYY